MIDAAVAHGCGRTAATLAGEIAAWLAARGLGFEMIAIDERGPASPACDRLVAVFPVLGDERIPDPVDVWLRHRAPRSQRHAICMTGDFRPGTTAHPAAAEADALLGRGSTAMAPPFLIDTPFPAEAARPTMHDWLATIWSATVTAASRSIDSAGTPLDRSRLQAPLSQLLDLLPALPRMELDRDGRCIALSLVTTAPYPRTLLGELTAAEVQRVLALAANVPALRTLSVPFAGLTAVPAPLPPELLALDLRGNPVTDFRGFRHCRQLRALNLAACNLAAVPDEIRDLPALHTLILAKNRLSSIPAWIRAHTALERLTLYRNQLDGLDATVAELPRLRLLNLGANPIVQLPAELGAMRSLEVLGLRMTRLPRAPVWLETAPRLHSVDASKTAFEHAPPGSRPAFVAGMPPWRWDDVAR